MLALLIIFTVLLGAMVLLALLGVVLTLRRPAPDVMQQAHGDAPKPPRRPW